MMSASTVGTNQKENLGKALGRVASGVFIVTYGDSDERDGMLATWVCQTAFEPPIVTVAVKKERPILAHLGTGSRFLVNVLGKKNMDIFKSFAKPFTAGMDRFAGLCVRDSEGGPILSDAVSHLSCTVLNQVVAGDHYLVVAEVTDGELMNADNEPMIHLRSSGFQY